MDLILTGRPVDATEAHQIGLVNRLAPSGESRRTAEALAHQLAEFPQTCMRQDRLSVLEQNGRPMAEALAGELEHGRISLAQVDVGLAAYRAGSGRHGSFDT